jgi:hypothetical protein
MGSGRYSPRSSSVSWVDDTGWVEPAAITGEPEEMSSARSKAPFARHSCKIQLHQSPYEPYVTSGQSS